MDYLVAALLPTLFLLWMYAFSLRSSLRVAEHRLWLALFLRRVPR
jgi:hypothetical protein